MSPWKDAHPSHRRVTNEFRSGNGRRLCTFPAPGVGRLTAVEPSACTVREPTYCTARVALLEKDSGQSDSKLRCIQSVKSGVTTGAVPQVDYSPAGSPDSASRPTRRGNYRCGDRLVILKIISDHSDTDAARAVDRRSPTPRRLLLGYSARYSSMT